ncbi:RND family efflux transporter MFP subunit [Rhodoblastus acidophilus]|uniref:efflux RND transporter periplasmic adaptor subunit n=1 Tax=Rhodoblastus acidophilus TaxID=1074 RepID=UPI0022240056|nr:efflux RND transporter periplasmic adaptor subunit [Rhodoblastus acidophilus]MCW2285822.1 RND family efflux transporter MFP subunit [Rhodoblastus acidophilus]MCW2334716.1 RND family efflux transporter MFP subunit [Rhodoblastus acidophilus]
MVEDTAAPPKRRSRARWLLLLVVLALSAYVGLSVLHRRAQQAELSTWTRARAVPYVSVIHPHIDLKPQALSLPGRIAAWYEASIHAQVSGYVASWSKDIGAEVKKNDVLAVIDTPELDERLSEAREKLSKAKAALELAKVTSQRWSALRNSSAVSKQSADEKASDEQVRQADLGAAAANLDRLKAQKAFAKITAPFEGVVTARNIDIGSYVAPSQTGEPTFKVADIHEVRVYVNVPQVYSAQLKPGMNATFTTPQWPGRTFSTTIATTSNAIGALTGSLLVEMDTPNPDSALLPGSFATVHFEIPTDPSALRIVSSALSFDEHGMRVATVGPDNRVRFKPVAIAKDFGAEVLVASGLKLEDQVINNPPETLAEGDEVRIGAAAAPAASAAK